MGWASRIGRVPLPRSDENKSEVESNMAKAKPGRVAVNAILKNIGSGSSIAGRLDGLNPKAQNRRMAATEIAIEI